MRISDWSSDVCSSDLPQAALGGDGGVPALPRLRLVQRGRSPSAVPGPHCDIPRPSSPLGRSRRRKRLRLHLEREKQMMNFANMTTEQLADYRERVAVLNDQLRANLDRPAPNIVVMTQGILAMVDDDPLLAAARQMRSEEHTSELQSL